MVLFLGEFIGAIITRKQEIKKIRKQENKKAKLNKLKKIK